MQVGKQDFEDVWSFVYLGAYTYIIMSGGTEQDIWARVGKVQAAHNNLSLNYI